MRFWPLGLVLEGIAAVRLRRLLLWQAELDYFAPLLGCDPLGCFLYEAAGYVELNDLRHKSPLTSYSVKMIRNVSCQRDSSDQFRPFSVWLHKHSGYMAAGQPRMAVEPGDNEC